MEQTTVRRLIAGVGVVILDLRNIFRKFPAFAQVRGNQGRTAGRPRMGLGSGREGEGERDRRCPHGVSIL